jgi:hypothetical protein
MKRSKRGLPKGAVRIKELPKDATEVDSTSMVDLDLFIGDDDTLYGRRMEYVFYKLLDPIAPGSAEVKGA